MLDSAALFIFDSDHIDDIASRLYGFYVTEDGLFTGLPETDISASTGAWVLVRHTLGGIEITQDAIGCFGLFLYRCGKYWALSNSFNHLIDYLKSSHRLTFSKQYADAYLSQQLCIAVYGETIIEEIVWLDRRAIALVDPSTGELTISLRPLAEKTIPIDTEQGLRILDAWHDKWALIMRKAGLAWPGKIQIDVSGGFDTRMVLAPALSSGISFDRVVFNSNPKREEDYLIATLLSEQFGFSLNNKNGIRSFPAVPAIGDYSERILLHILFEKTIDTHIAPQSHMPTITFRGDGGELHREYWEGLTRDAYINRRIKKGRGVSNWKRFYGAKAIVSRSFRSIETMLRQTGGDLAAGSLSGVQYYAETRNRSHFAMEIARKCMSQEYVQAPLLDPLLLSLRADAQKGHPLLTNALILTRYHDALASFPLEGDRCIPEETLTLAKDLNVRFPKAARDVQPNGIEANTGTWDILRTTDGDVAPDDTSTDQPSIEEQLSCAFDAPTVQRVAKKLYGKSVRELIDPNRDTRHPDADKYALVAIAKAFEDSRHGKTACKDLGQFIGACLRETTAADARGK